MNDASRTEPPRRILDSLSALLDTVLGLLHNRAELITTELEEEVTRLVRVLIWALAAVLTAIFGAVFLSATILLAAPSEYRVITAAVMGVLFLGFAGFAYLSIRRILRAKPRPFDASLRELEKDRNHLRGRR